MNTNFVFKKKSLMGCLLVATLGMSACSKEDENVEYANGQETLAVPAKPSKANGQPQNGQPQIAADPNFQVTKTESGEQIIRSKPVEAPLLTFTPSLIDVQSALADTLVKSVMNIQNQNQRNAYYQSQVNLLQTLTVQSCTTSNAGQASVCNASLSGKPFQLKMVMTENGWVIIN